MEAFNNPEWREPFNAPGIASLSSDGCIMEIGCVAASATSETVQALVDSYNEIRLRKEKTTTGYEFASPRKIKKTDWMAIGFSVQSGKYSLNLRGIAWQVDEKTMDEFIEAGAIPFLARGTSNQLLKMCNIGGEQKE